jgi:Fur family ferric uptake transcriptional regulator
MTALVEKPATASKETKAHRAILSVLQAGCAPLAETELRSRLLKRGVRVNKTTIYRQLAGLKERGVVREIDFGDGKKRFESNAGEHHHHLVCTKCERVDEIRLDGEFAQFEKTISKNKRFTILDHSLEFFGLCAKCK